jgi:hypothetical protein
MVLVRFDEIKGEKNREKGQQWLRVRQLDQIRQAMQKHLCYFDSIKYKHDTVQGTAFCYRHSICVQRSIIMQKHVSLYTC